MGFSGSFIEASGLPFWTAAKTAKESATAPSILRLVFCLLSRIPRGVSTDTAFKTCRLFAKCFVDRCHREAAWLAIN